jgi:hypothetical protein
LVLSLSDVCPPPGAAVVQQHVREFAPATVEDGLDVLERCSSPTGATPERQFCFSFKGMGTVASAPFRRTHHGLCDGGARQGQGAANVVKVP